MLNYLNENKESKKNIELLIYSEQDNFFLYQEQIRIDLDNIQEMIFDYQFKEPIKLKRGNKYIFVERNLENNGKSYYIDGGFIENNDIKIYETTNFLKGDDNKSNEKCGKFPHFIIRKL